MAAGGSPIPICGRGARELDISALEASYTGSGSDAYHPRMMTALLFYSYGSGTFSSHRIEQATYESLAFRYVAANQHPDHDTICTFRKRFMGELEQLFTQILLLAAELGDVSIDGSKFKANASKHKAMSWERACALEDQLSREVTELLEKAEAADRGEDPDDSLPEELARRQQRLAQIRQAKAMIEERAAQRYEEEKTNYEAKMAERRQKEKRTGKKTPGSKPKPPEPGPQDKDQVNFTDPASRIMLTSSNGWQQAWNAEAADRNLTPYLATGRQAHNQRWDQRLADPPDPPPEGATPAEQMSWRLKTHQGKAFYGRRKATVETVFGIIKQVMGFRQFSLRGLRKVTGE